MINANIILILFWFVFTSTLLILSPALPARAAKLFPEWLAQSEPARKILSAACGNWLPSANQPFSDGHSDMIQCRYIENQNNSLKQKLFWGWVIFKTHYIALYDGVYKESSKNPIQSRTFDFSVEPCDSSNRNFSPGLFILISQAQ